jgi:hypothetical protein
MSHQAVFLSVTDWYTLMSNDVEDNNLTIWVIIGLSSASGACAYRASDLAFIEVILYMGVGDCEASASQVKVSVSQL